MQLKRAKPDPYKYHHWFAWYPVRTLVNYNANPLTWKWVWLEEVLRRQNDEYGYWEYREGVDGV